MVKQIPNFIINQVEHNSENAVLLFLNIFHINVLVSLINPLEQKIIIVDVKKVKIFPF